VRVVAFDVGERRIGVAVSDPTFTLARPVGILQPKSLATDAVQLVVAEIARLGQEDDGVATVVVGLPRRLDGSATRMTARVSTFAAELGKVMPIPVVLQDERLTSHEAESRLGATEKDWRVRKRRLDAAAAAIILQDYLDSRRHGHASALAPEPEV
jgi:putative Holliday junction resolvase